MCALAEFENWPEAGVAFFTAEEQRRISKFELPGEPDCRYGSGATYYPRRPIVSVAQYRRDHAARLRSLKRAAGM